VRGWLEVIPDELVRVRPVLGVGFVGALLAGGEFEGVESRLQDAERWLELAAGDRQGPQDLSAEMVVVDGHELPRLPASIEMYRAGLALARSDLPGTVRHAHRAIELALDDDHLCRAGAAGLLGLASWAAEILKPRTAPTPLAWRVCSGPGTSPTFSAARSRWRTSESPKVASARRYALTSGRCSS